MPPLTIATENNGAGDGTPIALLYIEAVMLFPSDEAKRQAFLESAVAHSFLDALEEDDHGDEPLPASLVTWALRAAPSFSERSANALRATAHTPAKIASGASMHGGLIAAHVILIPLVMHFRHSNSVGRTAAYRVLAEWLGAGNQMVGVNERSLQRIWDRYQGVAHLWASFVLWGEKLPATADELVVFLSLAELIRCWGEQYRPAHSGEPLLDGRVTWTVPADFPLIGVEYDLEHVTMPDEWVRMAAAQN